MMTRQDWLLLVLAAAGGKPLSPLQLQKSLFLVGHDLAKLVGAGFYTFRPFWVPKSPRLGRIRSDDGFRRAYALDRQ